MAEEFLDLPQILPHMVEQDRRRAMAEPMAVISPTPSALHAERSRRLKARFENGAPEYPANTNCDPAKAIPPGARMRRPLKPSWRASTRGATGLGHLWGEDTKVLKLSGSRKRIGSSGWDAELTADS